MKREKRFSGFIIWTLAAFQGISLALVVGMLYAVLSRTLAHEFDTRLQAQLTRVDMSLTERIRRLEAQLRDASLNNAIRVSLMLGVRSQLQEHMERLYPPEEGVFFFVRETASALFIPEPPAMGDRLRARLFAPAPADGTHRQWYFDDDRSRMYMLFTIAILRQNEPLGTGYLLYDLSEDARFWEHFRMINPDARLLIRDGDLLLDMKSRRRVPLQPEGGLSAVALPGAGGAPSGSVSLPLQSFPTLRWVASVQPLHAQRVSLIILLLILCGAIFITTLWLATWIARRVSDPLAHLADQAIAIADAPSRLFLKEDDLRHVEFRKLARGFNHVLNSLLDAQDALRISARMALDASEKRYQTLVETSPTGILAIDPDGAIRYANPTLEGITGYAPEELRGMRVSELIHPDEPAAEWERRLLGGETDPSDGGAVYGGASDGGAVYGDAADSGAADGGGGENPSGGPSSFEPCIHEMRWRRRDGRTIWAEVRATRPDAPAGGGQVLLNVMDISQRKRTQAALQAELDERRRAEDALKQSEEKFRSVVNQSGEGIYLVDLDTRRVLEANPAFQRLLGYGYDELIGLPVYDFVDHLPADIDRVMERVMATSQLAIGERCYRKKTGEGIKVEVSANHIAYGGKVALSVVCRDITARKKLEREVLRVQKLESLGMLAGGIAHDFNNILTGILGNLSLARLQAERGGDIREKLAATERACASARKLTRQLLTFAKGGAPVRRVASLGGLLREGARFCLRGSSVRCRFEIPDDLWSAEIDEGQITQVINNLVINAMHAMADGGELTARAENLNLPADSGLPLPAGTYLLITISDKGVGIPEAHLARIFDPYFTTRETGTGLGLAVVNSIVSRHDGHITVNSRQGEGTDFRIYLPAAAGPAERRDEDPDQVMPGQGRVLVMDDERMVRRVAAEMLRMLGYTVAVTRDGVEAVAAYQSAMDAGRPFDLVIMDLTIPGGMGGREAIKRLLAIDPNARAIVSSGYSSDVAAADYRRHGFVGFLPKPYQIEQLSMLLHQALRQGAPDADSA